MKTLLISMGLIFILGGIRGVTDSRPTYISSAGAAVRPGYSLPSGGAPSGRIKYFGYIAIATGVMSIFAGFAHERIFTTPQKKVTKSKTTK